MDNIQLSQVICTRINHDLISNAGALSNALELMEEGDDEFLGDIKKILSVSSKVLSARMKFFRLAFGLENTSLSDSPNVFKIIETYLNTLGSMQYHFDFAAKDTLPEHNRVILLAVMVLADLMLKGGEIKTCYENGTLWFSAFSPAGFSESKIEAMEKIINGAEEYDSDAQYAHILCLREYLKKADKISLRKTDEESLVVSIKM